MDSTDLELTIRAAQRGYHLVRRHYYSPVPDSADCSGPGFWDDQSLLPGVDMGEQRGLMLLEQAFPPFLAEFRERYAIHQHNAHGRFFLINGVYMAVDAHVYYCLVRHLRPKRIVEIGSGQSTRLALDATEMNRASGSPCSIVAIEPYPHDHLTALHNNGQITLVQSKVQDIKVEFFESLEAGDILFIDSTHVLREGNDVQFEYLEILPRLKDGVYVHVHDISLPRRYPKCYFDQGLFWNEQYLLQAFLAFNSRFETVWAGNYLLLHHPQLMLNAFPEITAMRERFPASEPSAFWMRTRSAK